MSTVEHRGSRWSLPEIVGVEATRVHFPQPRTRFSNGHRHEVSDAVELRVRTNGPIPVRALGAALFVGETAVPDYTADGPNEYRFVAYEPRRLHEGAEISMGWPQFPNRRVRTRHRFRLDERAPLPVASLDEATPVAAGRHTVQHVPMLRGHAGTPPDLVLRWNAMADVPAEVDVVVHLHGYCLAHAAPAPPGFCPPGQADKMTLPRDREPFSGLDFSNPENPRDTTPGRSRPTLGILPRGNHHPTRKRDDGYNFPALWTATGLRDLCDFALAEFARVVGASGVTARRLIVTVHSGAGADLETVLQHNDPDEIHMFDATYGEAAAVALWAQAHITRDLSRTGAAELGALRVLYRPGTGTQEYALKLARDLRGALASAPGALQRRYAVEQTSIAHMDIPAHFGFRLLADAGAALPDVQPAGAFDVAQASRQNSALASKLGWGGRLADIGRLLGVSVTAPDDRALVPAVVHFQETHRLADHDGVIGPATWAILRPLLPRPSEPTQAEDLEGFTPGEEKALRIANAFENTGAWERTHDLAFGGLSGDFDGQGISFGLLQWNIGTGSLQPLLQELDREAPDRLDAAFGADAAAVRAMLSESQAVQLAWARTLNNSSKDVIEPWAGYFGRLAAEPVFQRIQLRHVRPMLESAARHASELGLTSERGLVLMFDCATQHGNGWLDTHRCHGCDEQTRRQRIAARGAKTEAELLRAIADVRAETTSHRWRENVRRRALTIVDGRGTVHGHRFDLAAEFGLGDAAATAREAFLAEDLPVLDATVAVPSFSATPLVAALDGAANAAAISWNQRTHPARSGVDPADIRARLATYVDVAEVRRALDAARVPAGTAPIDAVFVEAVHQFQHACFVEDSMVDGKAGAATLDSLGLVRRTGLKSAEDNAHQHDHLRRNAAGIRRDTGGEFTADSWFDTFVNPAFLGWTFRHSVHPVLVRKLRVAENALLALSAYSGFTPRRLGQAMQIKERHGGSRPDGDAAKTDSNHTIGLAVDINYTTNPWVGGPSFSEPMRNASLLINGTTFGVTKADLHALRTRSSADAAAELRRHSDVLVEYLRLVDDRVPADTRRQALRDKLQARQSTAGVWREGESADDAARRWQRTIAGDLEKLRRQAGFEPNHDPRVGFIDLPADLVVALRDRACLAWGAVDFGPSQSGDVMHFDCRTEGVGRTLNRGAVVNDGVPCVVARRQQAEATDFAENATDPIQPARPPVGIGRSVGRGGQNNAADVAIVQDALLLLRYLGAADHTRERPPAGAAGRISDASLAATIAAIEALQVDVLGTAHRDGLLGPAGDTIAALNRAIPRPTAAELAAITAQRNAINETIMRGVAIGHAVGNVPNADVAAGNANVPADVAAVQQRLVQLGYLARAHGETPAAGAAAPTAAQLRRTIEAIRRFQARDAQRWHDRGTIAGTITPGVVAPGDATLTLLDRISSFREVFTTGEDISFRDFIFTYATVSTDGIDFSGTVPPTALPAADYATAGATPAERNALVFVSGHEGMFDGFNSWDVAVVSLGFMQFAGGARSLRPFLAHLKSRRPANFQTLLGAFGIDIEFNVSGGNSRNETPVVVDPASGNALRGDAAEQAIRANKKLTAAMIRAGRNLEVQRIQVEAALRQFMIPGRTVPVTLDADVVEELATPAGAVAATHVGRDARAFRTTPQFATLQAAGRIRESRPRTSSTVGARIHSEQGLTLMLDRAVHEGPGTGPRRLAAAMRWVADDRGLTDIAAVDPHEQRVLARVLDDLDADLDIQRHLGRAVGAIDRAVRAAGAPGATVAAVLAGADVAAARNELDAAIAAVPRKVDLRTPHFRPNRVSLEADLPPARRALDFAAPPATPVDLRAALQAVRRQVTAHQLADRRRDELAAIARRTRDITSSATLGAPPAPPP